MFHPDDDFQLTEKSVRRMVELLKDGVSIEFIAHGLKFHHVHPSLVHYFKGPSLNYAPNLEISPAWLLTALKVDRLKMVVAEHQTGIVGQLSTLADVMAYLFSTANAQLLPQDWIAIYGYITVTTLSRHNLQSEKTVVMHHYERGELTLTEQERLINLRQDIRQAVVRLARQREIAWPRQPCSVPHSVLNQTSFRQLAKRRGKERSVLKLPGEKNDNVKEEETQKSSPVRPGDPL